MKTTLARILFLLLLLSPAIGSAQDFSVKYGGDAGTQATNVPYSAMFGNSAGQVMNNALYGTAIGPSAGRYANGAEGAVIIGLAAGYASVSINYSTLIGYAAGRAITGNTYSQIIGYAAGEYANNSHLSNFIGHHAGYKASDSASSVMVGRFAGAWADHSPESVFIGSHAGGVEKLDAQTEIPSAHHVVSGIYIGAGAGKDSVNTTDVILVGTNSKADSGVENAIALGKDAHATVSNSMNVPVLRRTGGGVLVVDDNGNITPSDQLATALATIAALTARIEALEAAP